MKKRLHNPNLAKLHRSYTVEEVADLYDVFKGTVRNWIKAGLPGLDDKRPMLILGKDLAAFHQARRTKNKQKCQPGEIYCVHCRAPKLPAGNMADYRIITEKIGNLQGICPDCDKIINQRVSLAKLEQVRGNLDITLPQALQHINEEAAEAEQIRPQQPEVTAAAPTGINNGQPYIAPGLVERPAESVGDNLSGSLPDNAAGGTGTIAADGLDSAAGTVASVEPDMAVGIGAGGSDAVNKFAGVELIHNSNTAKDLVEKYGIDEITAGKLAHEKFTMARDSVTGLIEGRRRNEAGLDGREFATAEAEKYVSAHGGNAFWAQMDIANLGGLNEFFGNNNEKADIHFKALSDIVHDEIKKIGANIVDGIRTGGDEFGTLIEGDDLTKDKINQALSVAQVKIKEYANTHGFGDIIHPKYKDDASRRGVGVHFGVAQIKPGYTPKTVYDDAITELDKRKKGILNESGIARQVRAGEIQHAGHGQGLGNALQGSRGEEEARTPAGTAEPGQPATQQQEQPQQPVTQQPPAPNLDSGQQDQNVNASAPSAVDARIRGIVEQIVRHRANASQINASRAFDNALADAKKLMNGERVKSSRFKKYAETFKKHQPLADLMGDLADREAAAEHAEKSVAAKAKIASRKMIEPESDDLLVAMAKLDGLKLDETVAEFGIDPADAKKHGFLLWKSFSNSRKARGIDEMREVLAQYGYPVGDTVAEFGDAIQSALAGETVATVENIEADIQRRVTAYEEDYRSAADIEQDAVDKIAADGNAVNADDWLAFGAPISDSALERWLNDETISGRTEEPGEAATQKQSQGQENDSGENGNREVAKQAGKDEAGQTKYLGQSETDLLGDNTAKQQSVADAERAKDEKRNNGDANSGDFTLTGSDREADQAAARGAQELFGLKKYSDPQRASALVDSINEGELILKSGRNNGRKLSQADLDAIERSVENSRNKLEALRDDDGGVALFSRSQQTESQDVVTIAEVEPQIISAYNDAVPTIEEQLKDASRGGYWPDGYVYEELSIDDIEFTYGDDRSDWPDDLIAALGDGNEVVSVTIKDRTEFYSPENAPSENDFNDEVANEIGALTKVASLDEILSPQQLNGWRGEYAASQAFKAMASAAGWNYDDGTRYFDIWKENPAYTEWVNDGKVTDEPDYQNITLHVRVSDHSKTAGYSRPEMANDIHINIAPSNGNGNEFYAADDFESALWKMNNATIGDDGVLIAGEPPALFSLSEPTDATKTPQSTQTVVDAIAVISKDQSEAKALNRGMVGYFKNNAWENAYVQRDLPDGLSEYAAAASAAFDAKIVAITTTEKRFNQFNGINYGGINYVNLDANVEFINIVGHEIYHELEKNRPDLHQWLSEQARNYYKDFDAYQNKLNTLVGEGEDAYTVERAESELLADFMGDALRDQNFVAELAASSPSKFKQLLSAITNWLKSISARLVKKDLGSSKYFTDVEALRKHLNRALIAYANGSKIENMEAPKFSRERSAAAPTFYSQLARGISQAKQDSMPAGQWKLWLQSNAAKLGIKKDEIQWSGVADWLDLQQGKVSKDDVLAYLDGNGVQVKDVMLGKSGKLEADKAYRDALQQSGVSEKALDELRAKRDAVQLNFSGLDLQIGGEGMKAFYDKIVPQAANDVLKKLGGGKVESIKIERQLDVSEPERTQYGWTVQINGKPFTIEGSYPRKQAKQAAIDRYRKANSD